MTDINLKITNNTSTELPISILGVVPNANALNNINTSYEFDMSGETLSSILFVFAYADITNPFATINATLNNPIATIQGYVDALNTLNIGLFTYSGTTIYMFSNDYIGMLIKI